MNYIVMDLEWNQSYNGHMGEHPRMPFEIIEIGAVKVDKNPVSYTHLTLPTNREV